MVEQAASERVAPSPDSKPYLGPAPGYVSAWIDTSGSDRSDG